MQRPWAYYMASAGLILILSAIWIFFADRIELALFFTGLIIGAIGVINFDGFDGKE